ncbi:hypothetical protein Bca101_073247 [Brassica carinata]
MPTEKDTAGVKNMVLETLSSAKIEGFADGFRGETKAASTEKMVDKRMTRDSLIPPSCCSVVPVARRSIKFNEDQLGDHQKSVRKFSLESLCSVMKRIALPFTLPDTWTTEINHNVQEMVGRY